MKCQLGHIYSGGDCPYCLHLEADESINVGDDEHTVEVPINDKTTEKKGVDIL